MTAEVIRRYSVTPFEWGVADCCTFVRDCLVSDGKESEATSLVWSNAAEAGALILRYGSLAQLLDAFYPRSGAPQAGDIAVVSYRGVHIAAYVLRVSGELRLAVRTHAGLTDWPLSRAVYCWRP